MANYGVSVQLTFVVVGNDELPLSRRVADAIERAAKAIEIKDKEGVTLTQVNTQSVAAE